MGMSQSSEAMMIQVLPQQAWKARVPVFQLSETILIEPRNMTQVSETFQLLETVLIEARNMTQVSETTAIQILIMNQVPEIITIQISEGSMTQGTGHLMTKKSIYQDVARSLADDFAGSLRAAELVHLVWS